ncbi:MAG: class I SAM-dependent methyltransferase [Terriglobales bacterium]
MREIARQQEDERQDWNRRYQEESHGAFEPDPFLLSAYDEYIQPTFAKGGSALDLAGGTGRHAIWLAELRWNVTVVDISEVAFEKAQRKAEERGVKINFLVRDLRSFDPGEEKYDLVLVFFYLQRDLYPALVKALKPGGLLIYKTYTEEHRTKHAKTIRHPEYYLQENELLHTFLRLRILHYAETVEEKGVAELVAQKR